MELSLEEVTLSQHASLRSLYELYKENFPLVDEQESFSNFRRCLALNDDVALQREYGPYREVYLAIRDQAKEGAICGGVVFGITTSPQHVLAGIRCTIQQIYLFRSGHAEVKRFFASEEGRRKLAAVVRLHCERACNTPSFRAVIGGSPASDVLMFFEVNNPKWMTEEQRQLDRDLSHTHPALRYMFWMKRGGRPLAFSYLQPALSAEQQPADYLDLFVMRLEAPGDPLVMIESVPGALLAAHLRAFFMISVLKGQAGPDIERETTDALAKLAARATVPVLERGDVRLDEIRTAYLRLVGREIGPARDDLSDHVRRAGDAVVSLVKQLEALNDKYGTVLFLGGIVGAGASLSSFGLDTVHVNLFGHAFTLAYLFRIGAGLSIVSGLVLQQAARFMRRRRDKRFRLLSEELDRKWPTPEEDKLERHERLKVMVRERWVDAFRSTPLDSLCEPHKRKSMAALLELFGTEAFKLRPDDIAGDRHLRALDNAVHAFPPGLQQARLDVDGLVYSWITCILPIREGFASALRSGKPPDVDLEIALEVDRDVADAILSGERPTFGETVTFMLMHVVDHDLQGFDPGELHYRPAYLVDTARENGRKPFRRFPLRTMDAEIACGRIIAVMDHLARLLCRLAEHGRVVGGLPTRCRIILRVDSVHQTNFLRQLGFQLLSPRMEIRQGPLSRLNTGPEDFLCIDIERGTDEFIAMPPTGRAFVGLLGEMAERYVRA